MRSRRPSTTAEPLTEYRDVHDFFKSETIPDGRFSISHAGMPVDFQYRDRKAGTTVVCFHGAIARSISLPWLPGAGVLNGVRANWMAISDPTLLISEELKLAWYLGNHKQPDLQRFIATIVARVAEVTQVENLVFFGGSGGGFAALEMSARFPGSLALPMNPQTSVSRYYDLPVERLIKTAWFTSPFLQNEQPRHDLSAAYPSNPINTIAYIQNTRDNFHIREHQLPFFAKVGASSKIWLRMEPWGDPVTSGHVTPSKQIIHGILSQVADVDGQWASGLAAAGFINQVKQSEILVIASRLNSEYRYDPD